MQADEYEQKHMALDGPVRFRDRQSSRLALVGTAGAAALLVAMIAFGLSWGVIGFMAAVGVLGAALDFAMASYRVVVTDSAVHLQHGLRTQRIPLAAIESAVVAPYELTAALFGRGLYKRSLDGSLGRYRAARLPQTVRVVWRQGSRTRTTIIATDRAPELVRAISGGGEVKVRVELGPDERDSVEDASLADRSATEAR